MKRPKNVVLILCDQLRKDCLSCYGNTYVHTPNIDNLAQRGIRYERGYTANPLCMPSRNSIFTGMYPRNHGLWSNGVLVKDEGLSIAHYLKRYGYQTANIGKIHVQPTQDKTGRLSEEARVLWNENVKHELPFDYWGFEYIKCTIGHSIVTGNYKQWFLEHGGTDEMFEVQYTGEHTGGMCMPKELHCSAYIGEKAIEYIKEKREKEKPFFLAVSFPDPHFPFTPPQEMIKEREVKMPTGNREDLKERHLRYYQHFTGSWDRDGVGEARTPNGIENALIKERIARTYDMIELIDENIGKIINAIQEQKLDEDTIILFLSDHGELLGDHELWLKGPFLYEGLINIPLILVNHKEKNKVEHRLVSSIDIMPTICELLDIPIPHYVDGQSFLRQEERSKCLVEYRNGYGKEDFTVYALIEKDYKLIRWDDGSCELSNFKLDAGERENRSRAESEIALKMNQDMLSMLMQTSSNRFEQICGN